MRILITGSRTWTDVAVIESALMQAARGRSWPQVTVVSGACPDGADALAERVARALGMKVERHPADWQTYGKAAGFRRNAEMVALGADVCLAFHRGNSRGTADTIARARHAGIRTIVSQQT